MESHRPAATLRTDFVAALRDAGRVDRGIPPALQAQTRAFARARREEGVAIEKVIIEVKQLIREAMPRHEPVFLPRLVGWTIAGYFAGTSRHEPS